MVTSSALKRRHFLLGAGALVAMTATGGAAIVQAPDPYSASTWEPLIGTALTVGLFPGRLAGMERYQAGGFGLTFEADAGALEEGLHEVRHPALGKIQLFMTAHQQRALAVINQTQGEDTK